MDVAGEEEAPPWVVAVKAGGTYAGNWSSGWSKGRKRVCSRW